VLRASTDSDHLVRPGSAFRWRRAAIGAIHESERPAGKETIASGASQRVRTLRNIRTSDAGEVTFEPTTRAEVGKPSAETTPFSPNWSPAGEIGWLTKDGLEIGVRRFSRRSGD
jgi:hypothetical protein